MTSLRGSIERRLGRLSDGVGAGAARRLSAHKLDEPGCVLVWELADGEPSPLGTPADTRVEPLVSAGKLVRDDDGQPIAIRRYSDNLLLALLRARRPPRHERTVRFQLPALQSAADAASAMAAITAGVAVGEVTPGEAAELSRLVEAYVKALEASEFHLRLRAIEARGDATRP